MTKIQIKVPSNSGYWKGRIAEILLFSDQKEQARKLLMLIDDVEKVSVQSFLSGLYNADVIWEDQ